MQGMEQRLLSRFKWGLSAELHQPDYETRISILKNILFRDGVEIPDEIVEYVAKNIKSNVRELEGALKGTSALLFSANFKSPAQAILKFRKKGTKPALKGAFVDSAIFIGDDQLIALSNLKSKEDLIGEIMGLLQSPAQNVISALQSGGGKIAGIVKTLSERN